MSSGRSIVVGHRGQDGRLLYQRLVERGDTCLGIGREVTECAGEPAPPRKVSVTDPAAVAETVRTFRPEEIYYLAAHHRSSEGQGAADALGPDFQRALGVNVEGVVNFLEAIRLHAPRCRLFYASSSLVFGFRTALEVQDEETPWSPACEYGLMKALATQACRSYRDQAGVYASCGVLYNHESLHRPPDFLSQKVIRAALRIRAGSAEKLVLGDLDSVVDWSYAPDFVDAFMRILSLDEPRDFIVASGEAHTVREFVSAAFEHVGLDWQSHVVEARGSLTRQRSTRIGNARRLREATGWRPSLTFDEMVRRLVDETRLSAGA